MFNIPIVGKRLGNSFVSYNYAMNELFVPISITSINNLFTLLRIAKNASWTPPDMRAYPHNLTDSYVKFNSKLTEADSRRYGGYKRICDIINAMDVYHYILKDPTTLDRMENGFITLLLLSDPSCPITCDGIIKRCRILLDMGSPAVSFDQLSTCFVNNPTSTTRSLDDPHPLTGEQGISRCSLYYFSNVTQPLSISQYFKGYLSQIDSQEHAMALSTVASIGINNMSGGSRKKRVVRGRYSKKRITCRNKKQRCKGSK
jgi:hypothetical protein